MKLAHIAAALCLASSCGGSALAQDQALAGDQDLTVNGIGVACTGITNDTRMNPHWRDYSLKMEFVGSHGQYLGDETLTVTGNNQTISFACEGPWALLKLPAGTFHIAADVAEAGHKEMTAAVKGKGQTSVIFRFPDAGGGVTAPTVGPQASR